MDSETGRIRLLSNTSIEDETTIRTGSSYREVWLSYSDDDGADVYACHSLYSDDKGETWPRSYVVEPASGGNNTLVEIDAYRIGVFYDRHPRTSFRTFYLEDLMLEG